MGSSLGKCPSRDGSPTAPARLGAVCNPTPVADAQLTALSIAAREAYLDAQGMEEGMGSRIIVVPTSAETGEIAREMAPANFELVLARNGSELEAALGTAEYMICYPNVRMPEAFY